MTKYWSFKSQIQDRDRTLRGDKMKKPTQYWFINTKPKCNIVMDEVIIKDHIREKDIGTAKRSLIHPDYAKRFIKEFIL